MALAVTLCAGSTSESAQSTLVGDTIESSSIEAEGNSNILRGKRRIYGLSGTHSTMRCPSIQQVQVQQQKWHSIFIQPAMKKLTNNVQYPEIVSVCKEPQSDKRFNDHYNLMNKWNHEWIPHLVSAAQYRQTNFDPFVDVSVGSRDSG